MLSRLVGYVTFRSLRGSNLAFWLLLIFRQTTLQVTLLAGEAYGDHVTTANLEAPSLRWILGLLHF